MERHVQMTTTMDKPIEIKYTDISLPSSERDEVRLEDVWGDFPLVTTTPTWTPRTFRESFAVDTTNEVLYFYDKENNQWLSTQTVVNSSKFGGTGADGALSVTSGTTNLDFGSASFVVKNYTTINIASGATLGFGSANSAGTVLVLRATGDVTIAGTIDLRGAGASGGTGGGVAASGSAGAGSDGTDGTNPGLALDTTNFRGAKGGGGPQNSASGGTAGSAGSAPGNRVFYTFSGTDDQGKINAGRGMVIITGAGGAGGGGGGDNSSGDTGNTAGTGSSGGAGGGALIIECAGALNFTGAINVSGNPGSNGGSPVATTPPPGVGVYGAGGGGGGGSAGMCVVLYNTLTSSSGTIIASGGSGGNGGNVTATADASSDPGGGGGGGGAASVIASGGAGGVGGGKTANGSNGSAGAGQGAGGGGGGGGGGTNGVNNTTGGTGGAGGSSYGGLIIQNGRR